MRHFAVTLTLLFTASLAAQGEKAAENPAKLKLTKMVSEAAGNPGKLFRAALFAKENQLGDMATELLEKVVAEQPDHKEANQALGHKQADGKWLAEVKGIWVEVVHKAQASRGTFYHDGEQVNAWEKKKLVAGYARHRYTRLLIPADDLAKAGEGKFPLAEGQWGDMAAADEYHSSSSHPWILRTTHCYLVSTLPYKVLSKQAWGLADGVLPKLRIICGGSEISPTRRPVIWLLAKTETYIEFGGEFGGAESAHGAFHTDAERFTMTIAGDRRPVAACNWGATGWGQYYLRHAAALAVTESFLGDATEQVPQWFKRALAGYSSRLFTPQMATYFGKLNMRYGAPEDLGKWLTDFTISGDNPQSGKGTNDYNIYQAGLLVKFCMEGGDRDSTDALLAVGQSIRAGKGIGEAVKKLGEVLGGKSAEVAAYMAKISG